MNDWVGLLFFAGLLIAIWAGLKMLSKPVRKTEEEFERSVAESASMLGASMNALQEMLNPEAAKAREVQTELRSGRFNRKKREGKANGGSESPESSDE
ncbi:MAG: hypothetical protein IPN69_13860 [Acidobacteria bacterium]|nr:hypothetical protein [Acidobacteriota bacterium]MBK8148187.1 hypothetical protein [Acidobacteriota bacterium]MBK8811796.1 hypothetical protein [Acidobacteriota bacterium]